MSDIEKLLTAPVATTVAALIAAGAAIANLAITTISKAGEESRATYREAVAEDFKRIGRAVHEIIALSNIQLKDLEREIHAERYKKAAEAARRLKDLRIDVRYTVPGIDEGFRILSRLPDWVGHAKVDPKIAGNLFALAKKLGREIDLAVQRSYASGRPPSWWRRYRVAKSAQQLRRSYEIFSASRTK
jgi:hypothetical protein